MRFLFVDRILELSPAKFVRGIKHVTRDDVCLGFDEHGKHCFIPSFIGEALGQLAAWNVMFSNDFTKRPVAGLAYSAKLYRSVYVGETLLLESIIDCLDESAVQYHSTAYVADEMVFSIEGALGPLLPLEDFIDTQIVRRQFAEIDRPGDWPYSQMPIEQHQTTIQDPSSALRAPSPRERGDGTIDKGRYSEELLENVALPTVSMHFDRILKSTPGESLCAEKRISRAAPYFPDHFPNKPVLPMTVLLECTLNLAQEFVARAAFTKQYRVSEFCKIKMNEFVYPGDVVVCYLSVKRHDDDALVLTCRSEVDGRRVCMVDVVMTVKSN